MKAVWVMKATKSGLSLGINKKDRDHRYSNGEKREVGAPQEDFDIDDGNYPIYPL
jgi:hypothetical protein